MKYCVVAQYVCHDDSDNLYVILKTFKKKDHYNCADAVSRQTFKDEKWD